MRVPYIPPTGRIPYLQKGGSLPGVQYGNGLFFDNFLQKEKTLALPALKELAKVGLPMAKKAVMAGLASKGTVKERLKAASQSALSKENLMGLAKTGRDVIMARPF